MGNFFLSQRGKVSSNQTCTASPPRDLAPRDTLRLAIPSKGRMAEDTLTLLQVLAIQLSLSSETIFGACAAGRIAS